MTVTELAVAAGITFGILGGILGGIFIPWFLMDIGEWWTDRRTERSAGRCGHVVICRGVWPDCRFRRHSEVDY